MASIVKLGKGKQPPRAIDFMGLDSKRKRLRLGVVTHDVAQEFCNRVERLLIAKKLNQLPDNRTVEWLSGVSNEIHFRMARYGLCDPRTPGLNILSLSQWTVKYAAQKSSELKPNSRKRLDDTIGRLNDYFGSIKIDDITPNHAADWRASMMAEGLSEATTRLHCRNAKSVFAGAVDRELIARNPFSKLRSASVAANRDKIVTAHEADLVLQECHSIQWKLVFGLARFAGLRIPSESHLLTWDDVNWQRRTIAIGHIKTEARIVPIVPSLMQILQEAAAIVPATERIVTLSASSTNLHRGLKKIITRTGLAPWDDLFQTLRRSAESDLAKFIPQHAVSKMIGHSILVSQRYYLQIDDDVLEAASRTDSVTILRAAKSAAASNGTEEKRAELTSLPAVNDPCGADDGTIVIPVSCLPKRGCDKWDRRDSNPEPKDYESSALTD